MSEYRAPVKDLLFDLYHVAELADIPPLPGGDPLTDDLVSAIVEEAARFFSERVAPTNREADLQGTALEQQSVVTAPALDGLYRDYCQGGWPSLTGSPAHGGQGLPHVLGSAVDEMLQSANMAFGLLPLLTQGVITALSHYGTPEQQQCYLPKLTSGEWAGTMNLTEPQAGSDLALIKTRAEPEGDHYRLFGQKIFITWGDHSFADNVIHMVLARTPDAPPGVRGISLFLVPKYLIAADGKPGSRNDVFPIGVEHKMGIHASPTCTMAYGNQGGAVGYLVGRENEGLRYMFAMMNHARLAVGQQGVAIAERACQMAVAYARERVQGAVEAEPVTIVHHPDVRRMLLTMRALTEAGRALTLTAMSHFDRAKRSGSDTERQRHQLRVDVLTPLVKGWCSEIANEVTSLGVQVHGGMGYIEETGAAQLYRDARIAAIYEGTNGIQALDLVRRKLLPDGGEQVGLLLGDLDAIAAQCGVGLASLGASLAEAIALCRSAADEILTRSGDSPHFAPAVAFPFLMMLGVTAAGACLVKGAIAARALLTDDDAADAGFYRDKINTARFYCEQILPRTSTGFAAVKAGDETIMAMA